MNSKTRWGMWMKFDLWQWLTWLAIVFAAGISGAWLSGQFGESILPFWWGFLGSGIVGIAIYGGVNLAIEGYRRGWVIVTFAGIAEIVFGYQLFSDSHDMYTALVLGIVPTAIAVLSGTVKSTQDQRAEVKVESAQADTLAWDRAQAEKVADREYRLELRRIALSGQVSTQPDSDRTVTGQPDKVAGQPDRQGTRPDKETFLSSITRTTAADVASQLAVSDRTARRYLNAAGFQTNGDGRTWHRL